MRYSTCKYILKPGLGVLKVIDNDTSQSGTHNFLLTFHSNHRPISHRFRDKRRFPSKIAKFSDLPRVFNTPAEGVPLGIWYRCKGHKSLNDGLPNVRKSFKIRLDTISAVTDRQPPSQPRRRSISRYATRRAGKNVTFYKKVSYLTCYI